MSVAAKPDQGELKMEIQRQKDTVESTRPLLGVYAKDADDLHRRRQDSDLEDASLDRMEIATETGIDIVLVNHNNGAVAVTRMKKSLSTRSESVTIG